MANAIGSVAQGGLAAQQSGLSQRLRKDYFGSVANSALTILVILVAAMLLWRVIEWGIVRASFSAGSIDACRGSDGACWSVIALRYRIILFGLYPYEEHWRAALGCMIALLTVGTACVPYFWTGKRMASIWLAGFAAFFLIVRGGYLGLAYVPTSSWGGLTLTLFVYLSAVAFGLPLSIAIALVRQSRLRLVRGLVILVVDMTRSFPLVTILFASVVILPFVISPSLLGDKIYRVIVGFTFFFACYQSENIGAGLQSIPAGQSEAARSLGLRYWQINSTIILPQAFSAAMPATVNQFVVTFKETSLVAIVGLFDLMTSANAAYNSGELQPYYKEVYLFVGAIYFAGAFSLGRYGAFLERRMAGAAR